VKFYRNDFIEMLRGVLKQEKKQIHRLLNLFFAFLPAAIIGLLLGKKIKEHLFAPLPILGAMIVGGIALWLIEHFTKHKTKKTSVDEKNINIKASVAVGFFQCLALWPGTSRSMSTILGARFMGLDPRAAARFSFLLAVPTLVAASGYDLIKNRDVIFSSANNLMLLALGILSAFASALWVIHAFVSYLSKNDLKAFAYYRIVAAVIFYFLLR
jgi:undecaprenyl-diphosphatase